MVKKTLLLCLLFLFCILALPVQSQATPAPTVPARLTNPTAADLADTCGLPATYAQFTSAASTTTFNMTADCAYHSWSAPANTAVLHFSSGEFTIDGNGHSIIGPPHTFAIQVQGSSAVLNLNNVTIRQSGGAPTITVQGGATLRSQNLILRDNSVNPVLWVSNSGTQATLRNVQFLDNRQTARVGIFGSAITVSTGGTASITDGIFRGNRNTAGKTDVVVAAGTGASVQLQGCMTFEDNVQADGITAANDHRGYSTGGATGQVTDSSTGSCPRNFSYWLALTPQKKSKKTATPRPSATARPLATTCIDLRQATGIAVHATYGLASGVQCQRLGGGGIGVQSIVDGGFIDAVDIWGYVEQGVEVCFPQAGELLFLDARTMPRAIAPLAAHTVNGMTCGAVETPGSIVLMPLP